jgi:hypothetical protein
MEAQTCWMHRHRRELSLNGPNVMTYSYFFGTEKNKNMSGDRTFWTPCRSWSFLYYDHKPESLQQAKIARHCNDFWTTLYFLRHLAWKHVVHTFKKAFNFSLTQGILWERDLTLHRETIFSHKFRRHMKIVLNLWSQDWHSLPILRSFVISSVVRDENVHEQSSPLKNR